MVKVCDVLYHSVALSFSVNLELLTNSQRIYSYPRDLAVLWSMHEDLKYDNVNRNKCT